LDGEIGGVLEPAAARDALLGEETAADREAAADPRARRAIDLDRQADAVLARPAIAVLARIRRRKEGGHGVGVRVMELGAVEAGRLRARCRRREEIRE